MKKFYTCLFGAIFLLSVNTKAQHFCGADYYKTWAMGTHPGLAGHFQHVDQMIREGIPGAIASRGGGEIYTIPVVVHVIHQNGEENIPDEQIENAIEWLNDAMANTGFYFSENGTDIPVRFCLAHLDPDNELTSGIVRVESPLTVVTIPDEDLELKDLSRWDPLLYMNIWIVSSLIRADNNESIIGNATLPGFHGEDNDGVIAEAAFFGSAENLNKAFIHEVGHYLGLYHTFEGGCENDDCLLDGDHVCDTPPDGLGAAQSCLNGNNSCDTDDDDTSDNNPYRPVGLGGLGDQPDMQQNFMDYSSLTCYEFFTQGQSDRIVSTMIEIRNSLLEGDRCNPPCVNAINPEILVSNVNIEMGENVVFTNNSSGYDSVSWLVNENIVSTGEDFIFEPGEPGSYFIEVILANDEPGCTIELEYTVTVTCPVLADFNTGGSSFSPNVPISIENISEGGLTYEWIVDGSFFSSDENIEVIFSDFGTHQVCLIVTGTNCTSTNCQLLAIGNCTTGNENRHWIVYTGEESINRFEFVGGETTTVTELLPYSENKSTISDENGNLLFSTNGEQLYNANLEVTPNGDSLLGGFSSRMGSIFVKAPGSDHLYYLFYTDMQEDNFEDGLHYSLVDRTLDNGMGDIVPGMKNIFISAPQTEVVSAIRHCNYIDFWLLYYNVAEERYESWLVTEDGIAESPVTFDYSAGNFTSGTVYYYDIKVSPKGNMFCHNQSLFAFDASNGSISLIHNFDYYEVSFYDFSPTGHYLFMQTQSETLQLFLRQFDVTLPVDEMLDGQYVIPQPIFAIYSDIQRTPNGEIFLAGVFAGTIDVIHFPELFGEEMLLESEAYENAGFINSFGNYFHAYSGSQVFVEGPIQVCKSQLGLYNIFGCATGEVTWEILPPQSFVEQGDQSIAVEFGGPGNYVINAVLNSECGSMTGTLTVSVVDANIPDLGPDHNICSGESTIISTLGVFEEYLWDNGLQTSSITVSQPGIYSVTTTDANGCIYSDQIVIGEIIPGTINLGPDFEYCDSTVVILDAGDDFVDYVWQDGTTGQFYTVYEEGTYSVVATIPCTASDEIVVEECTTSLNSITANNYLTIFPNPANTSITIWPTDIVEEFTLKLHDLSGRVIYEEVLTPEREITIDVSQWAEGLYHLSGMVGEEIMSYNVIIFR